MKKIVTLLLALMLCLGSVSTFTEIDLQNNVCVLEGMLMEGNAELITLMTQVMNQAPVQGNGTFNIIEP